MVWQPLILSVYGISTLDAAVHTFYELSETEFRQMTSALQDVKAKYGAPTAGLPLGIHPTIARQGLAGSFWHHLRQIFLAYSGGSRLSRLTFMTSEIPSAR